MVSKNGNLLLNVGQPVVALRDLPEISAGVKAGMRGVVFEPATKKATMKSSNEKVKASRKPASTEGRICGSTICQKVVIGVS